MFKIILVFLMVLFPLLFAAQNKTKIKITETSCAEKWWAINHLFVVGKAKKISEETRLVVESVKNEKLLVGSGNGQQLDAFRHTYWMARLTQEIGKRRAKSLGKAHEKGNYQYFKKMKNEDGVLPDKIASEMDNYNNAVGILIGKLSLKYELKSVIIEQVLAGRLKIIKMNAHKQFLDCDGNIIPEKNYKNKWINTKCLVNSNEIEF